MMYAAALRSDRVEPDFDPLASVRSRGVLALTAHVAEGVTRRVRVREAGALRMRFPHESRERLDAVIVNVAGGMAGGDVYDCAFEAQVGARLVVSSAAAEKVYRALGAPTRADVRLNAGEAAHLAFLPQETILFDGARLTRRCEIDLDATARLVLADMVILGRTAMGETVRSLIWRDAWRLRRGGALVWADATRIEGDAAAALASPATGGGACALATVLYAAPDAAERLAPLWEALAASPGCVAAATAFDGLIVARIVAHEGHLARAAVVRALSVLQGDALQVGALPRSWST
jgi:urease accessory protein